MKQVVNCAGVVGHRKVKVLIFFVAFLEIAEQRRHFFTEIRLKSIKLLKYVLSDKISMSDFQRHHNQRQPSCKHYFCSLRINKNVEFSSRRPVSKSNSSSHNRDSSYLVFYIREGLKENG